MAGIAVMGHTYNLPNYVNEIFSLTPSDTPFLSSIGGLTGGERVFSTEHSWQTYDLKSASQPAILEGADPTLAARVRAEVRNVTQIFQQAVKLTYTKMGATGNNNNAAAVSGVNPVSSEMDWQIAQVLKEIARDIEYSFINGTYQLPADNTTARKMRGILAAITTNTTDAAAAALTDTILLNALQGVWDNGGIQETGTATLMCNSFQKRKITDAFAYAPQDRNVGGVAVDTIETDFGRLNVVLNRHVPAAQVLIVSLEQCSPVFMEIPGKGLLFEEELAKTGAAETHQVYGEIGLKYGAEIAHGKITNLATS